MSKKHHWISGYAKEETRKVFKPQVVSTRLIPALKDYILWLLGLIIFLTGIFANELLLRNGIGQMEVHN